MKIQMGVNPKIAGKHHKMDGENNGKPYEQMDDLGGPPLFLETPRCSFSCCYRTSFNFGPKHKNPWAVQLRLYIAFSLCPEPKAPVVDLLFPALVLLSDLCCLYWPNLFISLFQKLVLIILPKAMFINFLDYCNLMPNEKLHFVGHVQRSKHGEDAPIIIAFSLQAWNSPTV